MDWGRNGIVRVSKNSGLILSRLWTKVHEILDNVGNPRYFQRFARLFVSCFVQKISAIKSRSRRETKQMSKFFGPNFCGRDDSFLRPQCISKLENQGQNNPPLCKVGTLSLDGSQLHLIQQLGDWTYPPHQSLSMNKSPPSIQPSIDDVHVISAKQTDESIDARIELQRLRQQISVIDHN